MSIDITSKSMRKLIEQNDDKRGEPLYGLFVAIADALERAESAEAKLERARHLVSEWRDSFGVLGPVSFDLSDRLEEAIGSPPSSTPDAT